MISRSLQERGIDQRFADRTAEMIALEGEVRKALIPKAAAKQLETEKAKDGQRLTEKEEEEAFLKGFNYDIIQEIQEGYSDKLKEELKSGRALEESKDAFVRRADAEGYTTYEGEKVAYGFRWAGDIQRGDSARTGYHYETQKDFRELGFDVIFIDGEVLWNSEGITHRKIIPEAAALDHSVIVVNKNATISPKEIAGHEAFHCWKKSNCREEFVDVLKDNLIFTSKEFVDFQRPITATYLNDDVDITDDEQIEALYEELFAYIGGRIHAGIYDAQLRPMFRNYDAVKAAWYELIRRNR